MTDVVPARHADTFEDQLLGLYSDILQRGEPRADRTGTGTIALFGEQLRIDLSKGFPAVTTKKLAWKSMAAELLWFLEGSGDERRLAEIQFGTRDPSKITIWTDNAQADYWKPRAKFDGDLGRVYGVQWRAWQKFTLNRTESSIFGMDVYDVAEIDQFKHLINALKTNPTDRRLVLSAWNPADLDQMALPPCHMFAQFYLSNDRKLSCQMYQRSVDTFLGLPFNIASYALLTHLIAHVIEADVGELIMLLGDTHIYNDHVDQVREQLTRTPYELPTLKFNRQVRDIDDFKLSDFELEGYTCHSSIAAKMSK